jgi:HK97 family phage prohead protease/HK97 family phage major capsid protein
MNRKSVALAVKTSDDATGTFTGLASVFDNLDAHGDIVRHGAFAKSLAAGRPIPLIWEHKADDPRNYVGDVVEATETAEGLAIKGRFDLGTEHGQAAYRNVKGRRVGGLSIGYHVRRQTKTAAGNELTQLDLVEISVVARGANDRALIGSVKSAGRPTAPIRSALAKAAAARYYKKDTTMTLTSARLTQYTNDRDAQLTLVKTILDAADEAGRDLTADEAERVEAATTEANDLDASIAVERADLAVLAHAKTLGAAIGYGSPSDDARTAETGTVSKHIALSGKHRKVMARKVIGTHDAKALIASGSRSTGVVMLDQVFEQGRPPQSILDVLSARVVDPNYSFLQQTTRTNNAAPVADGDTKPTSVFTVTERVGKLQVVAHLSEQVSHYALSDNANLEQFVADEMLYGLQVAVENQVINGSGTAPALRGILATSGIQIQAFATDILTSIRKGITKLEAQGLSADVLVISAGDWEAVELLAATGGATDVRGIPIDATARRLWGVQAVVSNVLPAKKAILLDGSSVSVDHDGQVDTRWSDAVSDDFTKNFVRCRTEGRFGLSVYRPLGVVSVGTAAD